MERELFINLREAQILLENYRDHYNHDRPHGALGYLPPAESVNIEALKGQGPGLLGELQYTQRLSS